MLCITDIKNSVQEAGTGALLIVSNYILGLIWRNDSAIYRFDSNSTDENANLSCSITASLLKFDKLLSLKSYIKFVYCNTYALRCTFKYKIRKDVKNKRYQDEKQSIKEYNQQNFWKIHNTKNLLCESNVSGKS